jgi:predicted O-methyltransferase YrrM
MRNCILAFLAGVAAALALVAALASPVGQAPDLQAAQPERRGGQDTVPALEKPPLPRDDAEKKILAVLDDLDRNQRRGMMNVPAEDGRLLRILTEAIGAKHVVELGTSNGYSGIWFCLALGKTGGKLTTCEIDARRAALARENFKKAGVDKLVTLIEGDAHVEVQKLKEPIDLVFIDADKEGYPDYLKKLQPLVRPGGLIVAHNMRRPAPSPDYLKAITTNSELETVFLNMHAAGVGLTLKKR